MTLLYGPLATATPMKGKLLNCFSSVSWEPHDIPAAEASDRASKSHRSIFSRKHSVAMGKGKGKDKDAGFPIHRRKSTISISSTSDPELDARTHLQGQSIFFASLPLEVRRIVYEYVMGEETVHFTLGAKRKFGHFVCEECQDEVALECDCRVLVGGKESKKLVGMLGALRSCRKMYTEAIPYLYSPHSFSILHITHLLYLPTRLPAARLDNIRTLRLRWAIRALPYLRRPLQPNRYAYPEDTVNWQRAWRIMAEMKGLRDLYVVLVDPSPQGIWERSWLELEEKLLEDVGVVKQIRWGEVMLPYASCNNELEIERSVIRLRKPEGEDLDEVT